MNPLRIRRLLIALGAAALAATTFPAAAQDSFPSKPLKLIVPLSAGSDTDTVARLVADLMSKELQQAVVVDNRPGAGGQIGVQAMAGAAPDGYTMGVVYQAVLAVLPHLRARPPFDPRSDLVAVGRVATTSNAIIVSADSPLKNLKDLLALAREKPDALTYASWGLGSGGHLAGVIINKQAGVNLRHVPYKGTSEVLTAVLGKQVDVGVVGYGMATTQSKAGKVRVLAVLEAERSSYFPGVPTASEVGQPIVQAGWFGLVVPAKTPAAVVARLERAVMNATKDPSLAARLAALSITPSHLTGAQFAAQIARDYDAMGALVEAAGIPKE